MIKISTADNRKCLKWNNIEKEWDDFAEFLKSPQITVDTFEEYEKASKEKRADIKDVGGFVGGRLKNNKRRKGAVLLRTLITLDIDDTDLTYEELKNKVDVTLKNIDYVIYSTHSHTVENPRIRVIIPINEEVDAVEYEAIARKVAEYIGIELFDKTTFQPERLMFYPAKAKDADFNYERPNKGRPFLNADLWLNMYNDYKDKKEWPTVEEIIEDKKEVDKVQDPLSKNNIVGDFCKTYSISEAIDKYLSDIYEPTDNPEKYTYIEGSSEGGLVVFDDKLAYSFHNTDPAANKQCNAFDLVRLHLFKGMSYDESYKKMKELINGDKDVMVKKYPKINKENNDWILDIEKDDKGRILPTLKNFQLIIENDSNLKDCVKLNKMNDRIYKKGKAPWSDEIKEWDDVDEAGLASYIESHYGGIYHKDKISGAIKLAAQNNSFNPVIDYLESLPSWDGKDRVERLFIDYLGAEDNLYTREVAKVHLKAAVERIYKPGCKYDNMVIFQSAQGLGKSTLIAKLSTAMFYEKNDWFIDDLEMEDSKKIGENLQGKWMVESSELAGMSFKESDSIKQILSSVSDRFRPAYGKYAKDYKRQCIFWGTSNRSEFLKDRTGNRRFYPIVCDDRKNTKTSWLGFEMDPETREVKEVGGDGQLDRNEVAQIWAEVLVLRQENPSLVLSKEAEKIANEERNKVEVMIANYDIIDRFVSETFPSNWDSLDLGERRQYIRSGYDKSLYENAEFIHLDRICTRQIFEELLGGNPEDLKMYGPKSSAEIGDALNRLPYTDKTKNMRFKNYGVQKAWPVNIEQIEGAK